MLPQSYSRLGCLQLHHMSDLHSDCRGRLWYVLGEHPWWYTAHSVAPSVEPLPVSSKRLAVADVAEANWDSPDPDVRMLENRRLVDPKSYLAMDQQSLPYLRPYLVLYGPEVLVVLCLVVGLGEADQEEAGQQVQSPPHHPQSR